ncbi:retron Ec67 family RNA-directed DNA polymerase/endonuclease [Yersinia ruckeri]|uniref:retron Ec67 family RNA-directed DNA polymerase/endonuclease n=1 Tax=Yersinia ruckeri TaxID=29486 RepID=UPI002237923A|nr:retron Ec67 family RNA-directed DNA polymerase/endonuclease [Yersinia ruckeri]MCW6542628.1 retron Ec67 family RNA-directed DNA polymerase/endonuclease [Yersinia ruckeri]MCW6591235.1 retron Ec67 family RNA-directed DNA polymerase/endonuclease [Yersinia ruckeri]UZX91042.1 retron Ec67 family RNA-directed DNA polymerase/endonuclease [Yersinia ruckeri]
MLNLDLSNFFDEFNFGRVRGYFLKNNQFLLNESICNLIAKIACYNNKLPQGSPCSPVITNLILLSLDQRLNKICRNAGCTYTRYADDITISTNKSIFPKNIITSHEDDLVTLNKRFIKEITSSGFSLNERKIRLLDTKCKQEVTGLTVNKFVNVDDKYARKVRAMAHRLFIDGEFHLIDKKTHKKRVGKINELAGMLGFIDSLDKHNNTFPHNKKLSLNKRERIYSKFIYYTAFCANTIPTILTEGKTDITYLRVALNSLADKYPNLIGDKKVANETVRDYKVKFFKNSAKTKYFLHLDGGSSHLKEFLVSFDKKTDGYKTVRNSNPVIMILDNDSGSTGGNGIFQALIGKSFPNITMSRDELRSQKWIWAVKNLYIVFTPLNGSKDSSMEDLFDVPTLQTKLEGKVFNRTNEKCAENEYGKEAFATGVVLRQRKSIDFSKFSSIFDSIIEIIDHHKDKE